jgi:hypothetical protein
MSPSSNDAYQQYALPDDFPISTLGDYREKIIAPAGPFDAGGSWRQTFGFHSTGSGSSRVGTLVIERRVEAGGVTIHVRREKILSGDTAARRGGGGQPLAVLDAEMRLGGDAELSTPVEWSFHSQVLDAAGEPIADTTLQRRCVVRDGRLEVTSGGGLSQFSRSENRTVPLEEGRVVLRPFPTGRYTVNWALFDAVARLPRNEFEPIRFTLLHHFDQLKLQQELRFRRAIDAEIAGKTVRLYGFDQTGRGVMPWTYWVDAEGRAVVVISGLETYMLESA